jgi:hypothetical protein
MMPDADLVRKHLIAEGTVTKECIMFLLKEVTGIFSKLIYSNYNRK